MKRAPAKEVSTTEIRLEVLKEALTAFEVLFCVRLQSNDPLVKALAASGQSIAPARPTMAWAQVKDRQGRAVKFLFHRVSFEDGVPYELTITCETAPPGFTSGIGPDIELLSLLLFKSVATIVKEDASEIELDALMKVVEYITKARHLASLHKGAGFLTEHFKDDARIPFVQYMSDTGLFTLLLVANVVAGDLASRLDRQQRRVRTGEAKIDLDATEVRPSLAAVPIPDPQVVDPDGDDGLVWEPVSLDTAHLNRLTDEHLSGAVAPAASTAEDVEPNPLVRLWRWGLSLVFGS